MVLEDLHALHGGLSLREGRGVSQVTKRFFIY